jgi:hypothetical protein
LSDGRLKYSSINLSFDSSSIMSQTVGGGGVDGPVKLDIVIACKRKEEKN